MDILWEFLLTCLLRGMTWRERAFEVQVRFLLTCLLRGMTGRVAGAGSVDEFLLTCLLRGMTIHGRQPQHKCGFLLTCLLRGMTYKSNSSGDTYEFLLTCLLRGMTIRHGSGDGVGCVSTHMPLARHDKPCRVGRGNPAGFYSHASCEA